MTLKKQIKSIKKHDPAIRSTAEALLYQGLWANMLHRLAHKLYGRKYFFMARLVSQFSRLITGIEIHPGARIAKDLFIDHGAGVVIGETCTINSGVVIFHGVTLGGTGHHKAKRHPTIGKNVTIGAGALVLGPIKIGDNAKIGSGAIVLEDVMPGDTVVSEKSRIANREASTKKELAIIKERLHAIENRKV